MPKEDVLALIRDKTRRIEAMSAKEPKTLIELLDMINYCVIYIGNLTRYK